MVVGERPIAQMKEFSPLKRLLQRLGSAVVRFVSATDVPDAPSGFRAIHREAALQLCVFSNYTYTLETLIQAGRKGLPVASVPVRVNRVTRPSRLVRSMPSYVGEIAGDDLPDLRAVQAVPLLLRHRDDVPAAGPRDRASGSCSPTSRARARATSSR